MSSDVDDEPRRPRSLPPSMRYCADAQVSKKACADSVTSKKEAIDQDVSTEASDDDNWCEVNTSTKCVASTIVHIPVPQPQANDQSCPTRWNLSATACAHTERLHASRIEKVVMATKNLLVAYPYLSTVEVTEHSACWLIVVQYPPQYVAWQEEMLEFAKEALDRASQLDGIFLLGRQRQPFHTMPKGFAATLAVTSNKHNACWDMHKKGFCQYGTHCYWEHPSYQRKVYVKMVPASSTTSSEGW